MDNLWKSIISDYERCKYKNITDVINDFFGCDYNCDIFLGSFIHHIAIYIGDYESEDFIFRFNSFLTALVGNQFNKIEYGPSYIAPRQYGTPGWWFSIITFDNKNIELFTCKRFGKWIEYSDNEKKSLMSHYAIGVESMDKFEEIINYINGLKNIKMLMLTENDSVGHTYAHFKNIRSNVVMEIIFSSQ